MFSNNESERGMPPEVYATFIRELQELEQRYPEDSVLAAHFLESVKKVLGYLFDMKHAYTFEELMRRVDTFYDTILALEQQITKLKEEFDTLKRQGNSKETAAMLTQLSASLHAAEEKKGQVYHIGDKLSNEVLKQRLETFIKRVSYLSYADTSFTRQEMQPLLYDLIELINYFYLPVYDKHRTWDTLTSLFSGIYKQELGDAVTLAEGSIAQKKYVQAHTTYQKILGMYERASHEEKVKYYSKIYSIWYQLLLAGALGP